MAVAGLIGRKLGMTQVYTPEGVLVPVTVIQAGPCTVVARRGNGAGTASIQLGFGVKKAQRLNKPMRGQFGRAGVDPAAVLREFRLSDGDAPVVGSAVTVRRLQGRRARCRDRHQQGPRHGRCDQAPPL